MRCGAVRSFSFENPTVRFRGAVLPRANLYGVRCGSAKTAPHRKKKSLSSRKALNKKSFIRLHVQFFLHCGPGSASGARLIIQKITENDRCTSSASNVPYISTIISTINSVITMVAENLVGLGFLY